VKIYSTRWTSMFCAKGQRKNASSGAEIRNR